ncbi:DUF6051 family protein [Parabacteroides sp. PF5-6]|uniref:DUF6051 family protein n=1 Tax=Parabacteroides sp. PF5-6 TaxID=1742403 RepID=UPI002404B03E|nr:DUF6051 family protein [Parabacteroides sp. PF5-6]MDF9831103.1 pimeloyl-ACP methyl ester carboxylesterase [Parabacteroides sp. PF5-6]
MDLFRRNQELNQLFSYNQKAVVEENRLEIIPFRFAQVMGSSEINALQKELATTDFCHLTDDHIEENKSFVYTCFVPSSQERYKEAIILLHGLNERSWNKYLTWAEYLAKETNRPVILFPIAFHMNRSPGLWSNPRQILPWVAKRKEAFNNNANLTFANLALSWRISHTPLRFYASGRESVFNLCQLVQEIHNGEHPLFFPGASVNLFAYSIGALLSQVLLLANPDELFSHTRLFMFCGGSIFSEMNGNARDIMDKESYERMTSFYLNDFLHQNNLPHRSPGDRLEKAFKAMIRPDFMREERESFFRQACHRIKAISLKKDIVVPTAGIIKALGKTSGKILEELDFAFPYSHQTPFPMHHPAVDKEEVNKAFESVLGKAALFLGSNKP